MRSVWIGHDHRQPLSYNVMRYSIERHASKPISVNGLILNQLPISREGATQFTFSRFLTPYVAQQQFGEGGISLFADEDMVVRGDIHELFDYLEGLGDDWMIAVMKEQDLFEWPSVMAFNNKNCSKLTPEFVQDNDNPMYGFTWLDQTQIAELPKEWNHCCGYAQPTMDAKLYHWTQGIPYWTECRGLKEDEFWFEEFEVMMKSVDWIDLHRGTKHFRPVMARFLSTYGVTVPQ